MLVATLTLSLIHGTDTLALNWLGKALITTLFAKSDLYFCTKSLGHLTNFQRLKNKKQTRNIRDRREEEGE